MKNLIQPILDFKTSKIKRYPCFSNRASSIGYFVPMLEGCVRRGVYERTHWKEKELYDAKVQLIFDEGHNQERQVLLDLAEAGISIILQQSADEWKEYNITLHIDGAFVEDDIAYPVEIKSMHPKIYSAIHCIDDFKKKPWTRAYLAQMTIYMLCKNVDKGIFILKNKSSGELKQITVDLDYELGEACLKTAEAINKHISEGTLPDRINDREKCKECPFKAVCLPEISFGEPLKIHDDPIYEKRIDRYFELKNSSDECKKIYELIREEAKSSLSDTGQLNEIVGKHHLTGKLDAKKALRLSIKTI
ncbi:MAG: CRISPR-associated protein Cas4 [Desulfobacterales bacterium]